jgi:peptidoglycan/LPS O-acetylase OafA/YrhL
MEAIGLMFIFTAVITAPTTLFGRVLNWKPVAFLGVLSYSMYLTHRLVLLLVARYLHAGLWIDSAIALVLTVAVSYGIYRLVERPMIKLGRRFQPHLEDRTTAVSGPPRLRAERP